MVIGNIGGKYAIGLCYAGLPLSIRISKSSIFKILSHSVQFQLPVHNIIITITNHDHWSLQMFWSGSVFLISLSTMSEILQEEKLLKTQSVIAIVIYINSAELIRDAFLGVSSMTLDAQFSYTFIIRTNSISYPIA